MDLYLVPNDPLHTTLISANGVAHYQVRTSRPLSTLRASTTRIQRPADTEALSIVGEVTWGRLGQKAVVKSALFNVPGGHAQGYGHERDVRVKDLLWKEGPFERSRYFVGNDTETYKWKFTKGIGFQLIHITTSSVKAFYNPAPKYVAEGMFQGMLKTCLRIHPSCVLDIDIIVLTFIIMEKKRRDNLDEDNIASAHDEEPVEAGTEAGGG